MQNYPLSIEFNTTTLAYLDELVVTKACMIQIYPDKIRLHTSAQLASITDPQSRYSSGSLMHASQFPATISSPHTSSESFVNSCLCSTAQDAGLSHASAHSLSDSPCSRNKRAVTNNDCTHSGTESFGEVQRHAIEAFCEFLQTSSTSSDCLLKSRTIEMNSDFIFPCPI
jgi:hypothetical protein